jgi:hypothetical protein
MVAVFRRWGRDEPAHASPADAELVAAAQAERAEHGGPTS